MARLIGGFGSAGAGNRTGRRTAINGGIAQTAALRDSRSSGPDTTLKIPTKDELKESISQMRCWWCGRDRTRHGRFFSSLAGHWQKYHGMNAQIIRDILEVSKDTSFASDELKASCSQRAKQHYDPDILRYRKGAKKQLSAYGVTANRQKATHNAERLGPSGLRDHMRAMALKQGPKTKRPSTCTHCGGTFWIASNSGSKNPRRTCSDHCEQERRKQNGSAISAAKSIAARDERCCSVCGKSFVVRRSDGRITCGSSQCLRIEQSRKASARDKASYESAAEAKRRDQSTIPNRLLPLLGHQFTFADARAAGELLGIEHKNVSAMLSSMVRQKRIDRIDRGKYCIPER